MEIIKYFIADYLFLPYKKILTVCAPVCVLTNNLE